MRSFFAADGPTPRLSQYRSSSGLFGAVFALFITLVLYTALLAADTSAATAPAAQLAQNINAAAAPALTSNVTTLFVQGGLAAPVGGIVDVPLALDTAGAHVAALSFSLDYDATCLALDPTDSDQNGVPEAIVIDAPAQFRAFISVNPNHRQGRLDVLLIDYIPPLASLRDTPSLITIQFRVICPLAPGLIDYAYVRFATLPAAGFSDNDGRDLPGVTREGVVQIIGAIPGATPTPTQTPFAPVGSPTPTLIATAPSTSIPAPVVLLETMTAPERIARTDRSVIFVVDYVVLTAVSNVTLRIEVPEHTNFDTAASTLGWQCSTEIVNRVCQFPLYVADQHEANRQTTMSGRLFFAVTLNWPLPPKVTQIAFVATIVANGEPSSQIEPVVLPVLSTDATPLPDGLALTLQSMAPELVAGREHELLYSFTYTNSGQSTLKAVELRLVLPPAATVRAPAGGTLQWNCPSAATEQDVCTIFVQEIQPNGQAQAPFLLQLEPSAVLKMGAVVLVAYAVQEERMLSGATSIVPIRQSAEGPSDDTLLFLPFIINGQGG